MKTFSKIAIVLLPLLVCSTFSCKKEMAPLSVSKKNAALSSSTYGQVNFRFNLAGYGLAVDAAFNIYLADGQPERLLEIRPGAYYRPWPYTSPDLLGSYVDDITFGPDSALYFADPSFHLVKRVTLSGAVTTVAGRFGVSGHNDGPDSVATFGFTQRITSCAEGNLYITETNPSDIRVITPGAGGIVYTLYNADKPGAIIPFAIAVYQGNIYFSDNSNTIAKIAPDGTLSIFATGIAAYALAFDSSGNLYASDNSHNKIMKITPDGCVSLLTGDVYQPRGITVHGDYLYECDFTSIDFISLK